MAIPEEKSLGGGDVCDVSIIFAIWTRSRTEDSLPGKALRLKIRALPLRFKKHQIDVHFRFSCDTIG